MLKYRCPYCAEKGLSFASRCGIWVSTRSAASPYNNDGRFICMECGKSPELFFGKCNSVISLLISGVLPLVVVLVFAFMDISANSKAVWLLIGIPLFLVFVSIYHLLFAHFDKERKKERDADGRLTLFVPAQRVPRVKKWHIYLVRFPKRGTNAASPVLYGMVCGKTRTAEGRQLELRVIRTDNMDLPAIDEPAWLITDSDKVVEGTVTAVTPSTDDPRRYRRER